MYVQCTEQIYQYLCINTCKLSKYQGEPSVPFICEKRTVHSKSCLAGLPIVTTSKQVLYLGHLQTCGEVGLSLKMVTRYKLSWEGGASRVHVSVARVWEALIDTGVCRV